MTYLRTIAICALSFCLAAESAGQAPVRDYRYALQSEGPWLQSGNAAALSSLGADSFSSAVLSFGKYDGGLVSTGGSDDCLDADLYTESYKRISDRLVFSGRLGYSYFSGKNMGGQILMEPLYNPVNFLEADLSTAGGKVQEDYSMSGGLSWSPSGRWAAGVQMDYTASDRTKHKDPRFRNVWMDLRVSPGAAFALSDDFRLGTNLIYRRTIEQLTARLFGTVDREYSILVDQGSFYGTQERFEGDIGYVSATNDRTMINDFAGLSFQMGTASFYNQLTALWRSGYYGKRSSSSVVFCEFSGPEAEYSAELRIRRADRTHIVRADAGWKRLSNYTNSYSYTVEEGMNAQVVYHGSNLSLLRNDLSLAASYVLNAEEGGFLPGWVAEAHADGFVRSQTTTAYPSYREQYYFNAGISLRLERNMKLGKGCLTLGGGALFRIGGGTPASDGSSASGTSKMKSFDEYLYTQFEYDTAPRAGAGLYAAYTWLHLGKAAPYIRISDDFLSLARAPEHLSGAWRNAAVACVGVNF